MTRQQKLEAAIKNNAQQKLEDAIKNNDKTLLREAISEGCQINYEPKGSGLYSYSSPNRNNTIYKAIEAGVGLDFFQVLLENGAHFPEDNGAYIYDIYGRDRIHERFTDALFHAVYVNGNVRDEKKSNNERVINFIIEKLSPEHSEKILTDKFGILYQALENTTCSANVINALIRKGAVVNNEHDGSLNQLFRRRCETDQEMAKIAANILEKGRIINYPDTQLIDSNSINRAVNSSRNVGAETIKVLLEHGATVSEYTIKQVLNPRNFRKDVAELLVNNFKSPNPQVFLDHALQIKNGGQESIDFVITHIFDSNLLNLLHHPKKQEMLNRLKKINEEIDSKNHQQIKEIAQHSNAIGSVSGFSSDSVENIPGYEADKNFAKRTGIKGIKNKVEDMTNSYDKELPNDKPLTPSASLVSKNLNQQETRK